MGRFQSFTLGPVLADLLKCIEDELSCSMSLGFQQRSEFVLPIGCGPQIGGQVPEGVHDLTSYGEENIDAASRQCEANEENSRVRVSQPKESCAARFKHGKSLKRMEVVPRYSDEARPAV